MTTYQHLAAAWKIGIRTTVICFFFVEIFSSCTKTPKFFYRKFNLTKNLGTWKRANNFTYLRSFHLLLSTFFCLHVNLKWNINFVYKISHVKYNTFRKFSARNIFIRKRNDENFAHELFGIEINANENKTNYGIMFHSGTFFSSMAYTMPSVRCSKCDKILYLTGVSVSLKTM